MEKWLRKKRRLISLFLSLVIGASAMLAVPVQAVGGGDISKKARVFHWVNKKVVKPNMGESLDWFGSFLFRTPVHEGEFFEIQLPDLTNARGVTKDIPKMPDMKVEGKTVATGIYDNDKNKVVYTFLKEAENHKNLNLRLQLPIAIDTKKVPFNTELTLVSKIGDNTFTDHVAVDYQMRESTKDDVALLPESVQGDPPNLLSSIRSFNNDGTFECVIYINASKQPINASIYNPLYIDFGFAEKDFPEKYPGIISGGEVINISKFVEKMKEGKDYIADEVGIYQTKPGSVLPHSFSLSAKDLIELGFYEGEQAQRAHTLTIDHPSSDSYAIYIKGHQVSDNPDADFILWSAARSRAGYQLTNSTIKPYSGEGEATSEMGYSIGDRVWLDANHDGIQDEDETQGVPGVSVYLIKHLEDGIEEIIDRDETDGSGYYTFNDVVKGQYTIKFEPPEGYKASPVQQGASDKDSNGLTASITVNDQSDLTIDLGLYREKEGRHRITHKFYSLTEGEDPEQIPEDKEPDFVDENEGSGVPSETFSARAKHLKGYELKKVTSTNLTRQPSVNSPDFTANYVADQTITVDYIYVRTVKQPGEMEVTHRYFVTPDGKYDPVRDAELKPVAVAYQSGHDYDHKTFVAEAMSKDGFELVTVDSSENVENKPSLETPRVVNHYKSGEKQTLTYNYAKAADVEDKTGSVEIIHKLVESEGGTELQKDTETYLNKQAGTDYTSTELTPENGLTGDHAKYEFVGMDKSSHPASGTIEGDKTKQVIYLYRSKVTPTDCPKPDEFVTITVLAKSKAEEGEAEAGEKELAKYTVSVKKGGDYEVVPPYVKDYANPALKSGDLAKGQATEDKTITYFYEKPEMPAQPAQPQKRTITVQFIEKKDGNESPISDPHQFTVDDGQAYSTYPREIASYHQVGQEGDPEKGQADADKTVKYIYEKTNSMECPTPDEYATITVNYEDEAGQRISAPTELKVLKNSTYDLFPKQIAEKDYREVKKGSDPASGQANDNKTITFVYQDKANTAEPSEPQQHTITVIYEDEKGGEISRKEIKVKENTPYEVEPKYIKDKDFVSLKEGSDPASGQANGNKTITFVYKDRETTPTPTPTPEVAKHTITVIYEDEQGNELARKEISVNENERYEVEPKAIAEKEYVRVKEGSDEPQGVADANKRVVFVYQAKTCPAPASVTIEVQYLDKATNEKIAESKTLTVIKDSQYSVDPTAVENYTYDSPAPDSAAAKGQADQNKVVKFLYVKAPARSEQVTITLKYVNEKGEMIDESTHKVDKDSEYKYQPIAWKDYDYVGVDETADQPNGTADKDKTIIFKYEKKQPCPTPGEPEQPVDPAEPEQPGKPELPEQPGKPEQPDQPNRPVDPIVPALPSDPKPETPERPTWIIPDAPKAQSPRHTPNSGDPSKAEQNPKLKQDNQLPKTGEAQDYTPVLAILLSLSASGLWIYRRKQA